MTTIEKLAKKHFEVFGESPELSFWCWLEANFVEPNEEDLKKVLNDPEYWDIGDEK
jgi:hypothetical protein